MYFFNGRYVDYLSLTHAAYKSRILKVTLYVDTTFDKRKNIKTFKISIEILIIRSSHRNNKREVKKSDIYLLKPEPKIALPVSSLESSNFQILNYTQLAIRLC